MITATTAAIDARSRSGHSVRAIPQTAWATIATATSLRPCSRPAPIGPSRNFAPYAKSRSKMADGSVKAVHAARPPR